MKHSQTLETNSHNVNGLLNNGLFSNKCFETHLAHYQHLPWLQNLKRDAWDQFNKIQMPKRTDEAWRFADLKNFSLEGYQFPHAKIGYERVDIERLSSIVTDFGGRMIFEDNHILCHDYVDTELSEKGVIWEPLSDAFENHPELVQEYFLKQKTHLGSQKFYHLSIAYAHAGAFLYIPENVIIQKPLIVYHWAQDSNASLFPQTITIAEANSCLTLVDVYVSHTKHNPALAIAVGSTFVGKGAQVSRKTIQNWNEKTLSFQLDSTIVEEDAKAKTVAINLGAKAARFENQVSLNGPTADANLYSLSIADKTQEFDQRTFQEHKASHSTSDLLYKNVLMDESKTIFSGMIKVLPSADKTDAYQTNRNLLLSEDAVANSLPGLEIEANDVKCSHGATSGKLDEKELFYMLSRGISKKQAQELLVFGFLDEILVKIENPTLMDGLRKIIEAKLSKGLKTE